jgi:hypothetical protein
MVISLAVGINASRTSAAADACQVTLQYCLWDQWKQLADTDPRRLLCLASLVGHLLSSCVLPLSILKPVS